MDAVKHFLAEHRELSRRYFLKMGVGSVVAGGTLSHAVSAETPAPQMADALAKLGPYLTPQKDFNDVSRGKPIPHTLSEDRLREVGLSRDTWKLEVISDPDRPVKFRNPMTKADGTALDFAGLMQLAEKHVVRFAKVMTCLNIGCPLGMGIWEGVPLREIIWRTGPREDLRRVFYYGYHNDEPKQIFQSSMPIGRVLEDPFDLPPVIVCYKLNGQWLTAERGGPVRIVMPEGYGFKCIKWLSHIVLTNLPYANDTYANDANDVDSPLKSFAATLFVPREIEAGQVLPLSGYAQVGVGGLSKVQVWIQREDEEPPANDPYFLTAPWRDMEILPPPTDWGAELSGQHLPADTLGFDADGRPQAWPMRLAKVHWAGTHPPLSPAKYTLRSRTVDNKGYGQPMPRPFRKSGHAAIEQVAITVRGA